MAKGGKAHKISYPGLMLNVMCAEHNANDQYHELVTRPDGSAAYEVSSRMSIEFEVDGPYLVRLSPLPLLYPHLEIRGAAHCWSAGMRDGLRA